VIPARLVFEKNALSTIEIFCLEPYENDAEAALQKTGNVLWKCLVGGAKNGRILLCEKSFFSNDKEYVLQAEKKGKSGNEYIIAFSWNNAGLCFADILNLCGEIPLPPYLKRPSAEFDKERYQTIFANVNGSVAAPTAALHFTKKNFYATARKNRLRFCYSTCRCRNVYACKNR